MTTSPQLSPVIATPPRTPVVMPSPIRVLFFDVDGCVCTQRSHLAANGQGTWDAWDREACDVIRRSCEDGEITIVVSSTWRCDRHRPRLLDKMHQHGLIGFMHKSDPFTQDFNGKILQTESGLGGIRFSMRGYEIKDWLDRHPETQSYRILDDCEDFLPNQMTWLIRCDFDNGMDGQAMMKLIRWSNKSEQ